jgi:hypothetical protein
MSNLFIFLSICVLYFNNHYESIDAHNHHNKCDCFKVQIWADNLMGQGAETIYIALKFECFKQKKKGPCNCYFTVPFLQKLPRNQ